MLEYNNPSVDVDDLMVRVQEEVSKRGAGLEPSILIGEEAAERGFETIGSLIDTAHAKSVERTQWGGRFNIFPFNRSARLQGMFLKALAVVFTDQRQVNFALVQALREMVVINRELVARVARLETERYPTWQTSGEDA